MNMIMFRVYLLLLMTDALILDKQSTNTHYKIMQPNPVAFWPKSPSKIKINELSCHYTKRADSDEMYDTFNDFDTNKGYGFTLSNETLEGIQSMYVVVDIDNLGGSNNTVLKTRLKLLLQ